MTKIYHKWKFTKTVLILAIDIVDTLTIIRIAIERTLYFLKQIYKCFFFFLFKQFSFYFLKLFFTKILQHPEWYFIYFFNRSPYYFWCDAFYFRTSRSDYLINSVLCDFIYFSSCLCYYFRCNFTNLIYSVSISVREVVPI